MNIREINIIGAGSLGSFTTQILTKMHPTFQCPINVWDFDITEEHNINNQLYGQRDVGNSKVVALSRIIKKLGNQQIAAITKEVDEKTDLRGLVIVAVDSMEARKKILEACKFDGGVNYLIEARMGGHIGRIFALNPQHPKAIRHYLQFFYKDRDVANPICATNETIPTLWIVAASIARLVLSYKSERVLKSNFTEVIVDLSRHPIVNSDARALI